MYAALFYLHFLISHGSPTSLRVKQLIVTQLSQRLIFMRNESRKLSYQETQLCLAPINECTKRDTARGLYRVSDMKGTCASRLSQIE